MHPRLTALRYWLLLFPLAMWGTVVQAEQTVRVGVFDNRPIVFQDETGQITGIAIDVLQDVAGQHNWQLKYHYAPWNELLEQLEAGQIDILVGIAYSDQRAERFRFSSQTLVNNWGVVYQASGNNLTSLSELAGQRIALMEQSTHSRRFDELMKRFGFEYTPRRVPHYGDVLSELEQSRADAGVINRIYSLLNEGKYRVKPTSILFNPVQVRFAAPKKVDSPYLPVIDAYLVEAKNQSNSYYYESLNKWLQREQSEPVVLDWLWPAVGVIAAILLLGGLYGYLLQTQVRSRTRELEEAEARFRQLAEAVDAVFWMTTPDWERFLYISPGYKKIWGDDPQILYNNPRAWFERIHPEDQGWLRELMQDKHHQLESEYTFPEYRLIDKSGNLRWVSARIYPVFDQQGRLIRIAGIAQDVTEQRQTYLKLQESEQRFRTSIDHAPEAITILDVDSGRFVDVNKNGERLFVLDREQLLQSGPAELSPPCQPAGQPSDSLARQYISQALAGGTPAFEWVHRDSRGNLIDCEIRLVRLPTEDRNLVRGSITDITDRKKMQSRLQESRERLQTVVSSAPVVLFAMDAQGVFTLSEGQSLGELGLKPGEVVGQSVFSLYQDHPVLIEDLQRALHGEAFQVERRVGDIYFETHYSPTYDGQGGLNGSIGVAVNITERMKAHQALESQQQKLELALEAGQVGIWDWDMRAGTVEWSSSLEHMYGLETGTFKGHFEDFARQVYPGDLDKITAAVDTAVKNRKPFKTENRIVRADGEVRWVYSQARLRYDEQGHVIGMLGITTDLTEVKKAEEALRSSEAQLAEAQRIAHMGSWQLDMKTFKAVWSDEEFRLLGYSENEIDPTLDDFRARVHPEDADRVEQAMQRAAHSTDGIFEIEHRVRHPDGVQLHVLEQGRVRFDAQGDPDEFIGTTLDITEQKQTEQELLRHKFHLEELVEDRTSELQRINRELESFSYSVSHDLRAPLRAIDGFSQALYEDYRQVLDETGLDYLKRIQRAAENMSHLIDSLLKLSRLTRSKFKREKVDLSQLARDVTEEQKQNRAIYEVEVVIQPDLVVYGDLQMLRVMLTNLINNAIKYSQGKPQPRIEIGTRSGDSLRTVFYVADNGVGFDMRYVDKLFGAFQRLHGNDEFEGLGIGLATVQRIIHRHGGRIWAEGSPDNGAVFYFVL
ncbi:MAG: PAS domain S-box protein [Thiohalophilus sp.]|uniref:PAS domain S-box protein n=1 Tax=Thiohalophilus sp. TaxID=3028392 RepID=UPI002870097E|nr:PAS domain S-box protein [Thiohalophilus sp.]MDR9436011.1 PAS domain S-box protein [Thiohalophilus sp.]